MIITENLWSLSNLTFDKSSDLVISSLAIYFEDGFPILFTQNRTGWDGRRFKIYKLRSLKKTSFDKLEFISLRPDKILDPIYFAVVIINNKNEAIFYAPHGFVLSDEQLELIKDIDISLLITTFTHFKIPKIMGGDVNPGMENVYELYKQLSPKKTINTHDEEKKAKGLVSALAKIKYADYDKIESNNDINFIRIDNYKKTTISWSQIS